MNKKSFMRGFGTGVLFTAVILGLSYLLHTSDSQIIAEAKKLGMVFPENKAEKLFAEETPSETPSAEASAAPLPSAGNGEKLAMQTAQPAVTVSPSAKPTSAPKPTKAAKSKSNKKKEENKRKQELEKKKKEMQESINKDKKSLTITAGEWSDAVSRKLESLGIIKNAKDFDSYLNQNGYSGRITAGTYEVSVGDTYQELARKITGR